jgi:hypothetical protein
MNNEKGDDEENLEKMQFLMQNKVFSEVMHNSFA